MKKQWFLLMVLTVCSPSPTQAEDVGAIIATLNDPQAECRYLKQLQDDADSSEKLSSARKTAFTAKMESAKRQFVLPQYPTREEAIEADAAQTLALQKRKEYYTAYRVLQAKRGVDTPCTEPEPREKAGQTTATPPSMEASSDRAPSLEERLRSLKKKRENNQITPEQYYEERAKLLEGL
jgi:hypothetical protein